MSRNPRDPPSAAMVCGRRFSAMLRCVEDNGSAVACTDKINNFLACERAVFNAAAAAGAAAAAAGATTTAADSAPNDGDLEKLPEAHPRGSPASRRDAAVLGREQATVKRDETDRILEDSGEHESLLDQISDSLQRAIAKQSDACVKLAQTAAKPQSRVTLVAFARNMLEDIGKTCDAVQSKTARLASELREQVQKAPKDESDDP